MATTRLITAEDLYLMGEDEGRFELIEGELREMPPAGEDHGRIGMNIGARLWYFVTEHKLGDVFNSETGFYIERNPDAVLAPDAAFIRSGRLPVDRDKRKFVETIPDLVVEVISPSERPGEISDKINRYLDAGVQLVWVVYPDNFMVNVFRANRTWDAVHLFDGSLDGEDVLPGFSLRLSELFS